MVISNNAGRVILAHEHGIAVYCRAIWSFLQRYQLAAAASLKQKRRKTVAIGAILVGHAFCLTLEVHLMLKLAMRRKTVQTVDEAGRYKDDRSTIERDDILTVKMLSEYLRCHPSTIYRLLKHQMIPAFKIGADWRFRRSAIDEWLELKTTSSRGPIEGPQTAADDAFRGMWNRKKF